MSIHCAFLFPEKQFELILQSTIGFVSDNIFYRQNFQTNTTQIQQNPRGRSYQSMASSHKRGLFALADYGNNPVIQIRSCLNTDQSNSSIQNFQMSDICKLQILMMELSVDCKYLLVCCGIPQQEIIVIDIGKRKKLQGNKGQYSIKIDRNNPVKKMKVNPANQKIFAVMFQNKIEIYEIIDNFTISGSNVNEGIRIIKKQSIDIESESVGFENMIWDQINNLYISDGHFLRIYSTDVQKQVLTYQLQTQSQNQAISSFILTPKHVILIFESGRLQWLKKYYPDAMEQQDPKQRPLYLQKYFHFPNKKNKYGLYNHYFNKIIVAHTNGFYSIIKKEAESNEIDEQDQQNNRKVEQNSDFKQNKDLKGELQINQVGPFFSTLTNNSEDRRVILCKQIKGTCLLFAINASGRIIVWSAIQRTPSTFIDLGIKINSADISDDCSLLTTANQNGIVQFYNIKNLEKIQLIKQFRILQQDEGEISQIVFSSNSKEVACLCPQNNRIFYILSDSKSNQFQVLGYCNIPYTPLSITWHKSQKSSIKAKYEHLIVNIGFGVILVNSPPPKPCPLSSNPPTQINGIDMYACRTDPKQRLAFTTNNGDMFTTGDDLFFKKYKLPEDSLSKFNPEAKVAIPAPLQQIQAHDLQVTYIGRGKDGQIITGGKDGMIQIRNASFSGQVTTFNAHGWKESNLSICQGSQTPGLYYSCGKDGIVCMWKTKQLQIKLTDKLPNESADNLKKISSEKDKLEHYTTAMQKQYLQKMKEKIDTKKKVQLDKIQQIKIQLRQLLTENEGHEELQRLERDQFAIDLEFKETAQKKCDEICLKIKQQSQNQVLHEQVYQRKLKQMTWDTMQQHLRAINGLKNNYIVFNYQVRKQSRAQKRQLNTIMDIRRLQLKEEKKKKNKLLDSQFYANKNVINGGILQPLILTIFQKKDQKKDDKGKKKKDEQVQKQPQELQQIPKEEVWQLLYSSFELYSKNAKVNQIILMQNIIFKIKQLFNKQFNKMMKLRQSQNQLINDKNKRIIQICEELKRPNQTLVTNKNILQNPDTILQVHPNQIPFAKYLSREQRQKLQQQRLKEEQRLRKLAEDDSSQRALSKMMGGTLQQKKTSLLQVIVQKQKWMDKPLQEMTEEQKGKFKEYQQKKQKAEQQKQRMVKKLEAQLRKLKQQIDELMQKYDEKLFMLLRRRIQYDLRIQQQQLYCIKLSLSLVSASEYAAKYNQLMRKASYFKKRHDEIQEYRDQLREYEQNLQKVKSEKRAILDSRKQPDIETKIKTVEKSVFQEYNSNLKKRRQMEQKILESGDKAAKYQIIKLDPMRQIESKYLSQKIALSFKFFLPQIKQLQQTYEFPDSLINTLQTRFNIKKQEHQCDLKLKSIKDTIYKIQEDLSSEQRNYDRDNQQLAEIKRYLEQQKSDLEIQCKIKKGQVQIDNEAPIPKLEDALLIHKQKIDQKNMNIIEKAKLKIDVMGEIKKCKIRVTQDSLNLERKQVLIDQLSNMIKQIQMLKVKKQMQVALSKKDTKINQNQIRSLKQQIQKVRKQGQKRTGILQKKIDKVNQQVQTIRRQNKQLQVQKYNLDNTVKQRQKIKQMMVGENGGGNQEAAEKFQQISINRKLFDKAKQQTQEIQLLREQLSKLKAKTFANFSNVQR